MMYQPKRIKFSLVPQLDQYPWLVKFVQTIFGKVLLLATFSGLIYLFWPQWTTFIAGCLFFCVFFPGQRSVILVVASLGSVYILRTYLQWYFIRDLGLSYGVSDYILSTHGAVMAVAAVLFFCFLVVRFSRTDRGGFVIRRPVLAMVIFYLSLATFISYVPLPGYLKFCLLVFMILFSKYFWFLCYNLVDCKVPDSPPFWKQLGLYLPFWYVTVLPYHRGAINLEKIRAKTPEELARCQLKGLKLLIWACYLAGFSLLYNVVCYGWARDFSEMINIGLAAENGPLNIFFQEKMIYSIKSWPFFLNAPPYQYAFAQSAAGQPLEFYWNWLALVAWFFIQVLNMAIITHAGIAICRMAGYNALRNVYKPLQARTISGFWNRYYFYFKELLVNVFFYPVYFRYFKKRPMLRLYIATLAAAGFGNFLYHYLIEINQIVTDGVWPVFLYLKPYTFYCFVLANAIFLSQWRRIKSGPRRKRLPQPFASLAVLTFYCLLSIFVDTPKGMTLMDNFRFLFSLFNFFPG